MSEETLRQELYDSFKNRAMMYYYIFDELRAEVGAQRAEEIMGRAIYRRGAEKGREKYAQYGPKDLPGLRKAFLGGTADEGRMFQPEVLRRFGIPGHEIPLLSFARRVARRGLARGRRGHAVPYCVEGRLRHFRGGGFSVLCRYLAARRRRLLLATYSAGKVNLPAVSISARECP